MHNYIGVSELSMFFFL